MIPTPDELGRIIADEADKTEVWVTVWLSYIQYQLYEYPRAVLYNGLGLKIRQWKYKLDYDTAMEEIKTVLETTGYTVTIEKDEWEYYIHIKVKEV